ncbi:MAG: hypothetical protein OXB84_04825 [Halobacteriovoraceae bacterium]|nr:hypothetical protein [Halobacteriovoraceae bacterium]
MKNIKVAALCLLSSIFHIQTGHADNTEKHWAVPDINYLCSVFFDHWNLNLKTDDGILCIKETFELRWRGGSVHNVSFTRDVEGVEDSQIKQLEIDVILSGNEERNTIVAIVTFQTVHMNLPVIFDSSSWFPLGAPDIIHNTTVRAPIPLEVQGKHNGVDIYLDCAKVGDEEATKKLWEIRSNICN